MKMLLRSQWFSIVPRRFVSALYITGDKTSSNVLVLTPVLDFEKRLSNKSKLEENVKRRNLQSVLNLNDLFAQWQLNKTVNAKKIAIEKRRQQLNKLIHELSKTEPSTTKEQTIQKYKLEAITLRDDAKLLRDQSYALDGQFIDNFLSIPNDIHPNTSDQVTEIASFKNNEKSTKQTKHHLEYEELIEYYDETVFYLKNEAAKFDLKFPLRCIDYFRQNGFIQFSNPDFAKTLLIEGGAIPLDDTYKLHHETHEKCTNLLHLVGSGSMLAYLGFIAKLIVFPTQFPFQWVSTGKIYAPKSTNELGLYDTSQSTAVQVFLAGTQEQMEEKFQSTLDLIRNLYETLNIHFRIVYVPASELKLAACLSARIEMYSPFLQKYVEVGNLSNYSDFISKRILFNYEENKKTQFPHILSGTVCNVTKILAILLENNNGLITVND